MSTEDKAAAKAAKIEAKAAEKAKADAKKAATKDKADAKKAKEAEKAAATKAKKDAKVEATKAAKAAKTEAAKAKREAAKAPKTDVAELKVRLKEGAVEGYNARLSEAKLIELATTAGIEIPTKASGSNVIPDSYRKTYGSTQSCGDDVALALTKFVMVETKGGKDGKTTIRTCDETKLEKVASDNGVDTGRWKHLNLGMKRMNLGNVLRGKRTKGEKVKIGSQTFKGAEEGAGGAL